MPEVRLSENEAMAAIVRDLRRQGVPVIDASITDRSRYESAIVVVCLLPEVTDGAA